MAPLDLEGKSFPLQFDYENRVLEFSHTGYGSKCIGGRRKTRVFGKKAYKWKK